MARQDPSVASIVAERVRWDRMQRRHEVYRRKGEPRLAMSPDDAARCVARAGCPSLAATAMIELEDLGGPTREWALALIATAGEMGVDHLERMRVRRGWSELWPTSVAPPHGIDALVSPIADIRKPALEELGRTPRAVHLRALLLATELDLHIEHERRASLEVSRWMPLLGGHARATWLAGRSPSQLAPEVAAIADSLNSWNMIYKLIETGAARAPMETPQHLTPALQELERDGVAAFAARHMRDVRLTDDERTLLENAEVQLAFGAQTWNATSPEIGT